MNGPAVLFCIISLTILNGVLAIALLRLERRVEELEGKYRT